MFGDAELDKTIQAMADCDMNVGRAAKRLYVHRNTVRYRANKIQKMTGLNPMKFHDLRKLYEMLRELEDFKETESR